MARIVAATDFSAPAREAAVRAALVAKAADGRLELVHVLGQGLLPALRELLGADAPSARERAHNELEERLRALAGELESSAGGAVEARVLEGGVVAGLAGCSQGAAALAVGSRGENLAEEVFPGSTTLRLARSAACPLLVVKQPPHGPYARVLVAVDFSVPSAASIRAARALAPQAELVLLHVYELPFEGKMRFAGVSDAALEAHRQRARLAAMESLAALAAETRHEPHPGTLRVLHGPPALRVLEHERECGCDLLVAGRTGRGGIEGLLVGSVAERLLHESRGDILLVPGGAA